MRSLGAVVWGGRCSDCLICSHSLTMVPPETSWRQRATSLQLLQVSRLPAAIGPLFLPILKRPRKHPQRRSSSLRLFIPRLLLSGSRAGQRSKLRPRRYCRLSPRTAPIAESAPMSSPPGIWPVTSGFPSSRPRGARAQRSEPWWPWRPPRSALAAIPEPVDHAGQATAALATLKAALGRGRRRSGTAAPAEHTLGRFCPRVPGTARGDRRDCRITFMTTRFRAVPRCPTLRHGDWQNVEQIPSGEESCERATGQRCLS